MKDKMRTRQVHLDFHTSEAIEGIGKDFNKEQFQEMLKKGYINSITVFSKCHHGWAYHPSEANEMHPYLNFDLLKAQIEAAHEIGVNTPVYLSAGLDEKMALRHPEWLIRSKEGKTNWAPDFMTPGYHNFCFNTPYLDYLIEQVREVLVNYDADGIFLDIVGDDTQLDLLSPINGSIDGLCNILLMSGTHEMFFPDCEKLMKKAELENVNLEFSIYKEMPHTWVLFFLKESKPAIIEIIEFLKRLNKNV